MKHLLLTNKVKTMIERILAMNERILAMNERMLEMRVAPLDENLHGPEDDEESPDINDMLRRAGVKPLESL